jgi:subtilase family serine protease
MEKSMLSILKRLAFRTRSLNPFRSRRRLNLKVETLESRTLLSFTPTQVAHAYGFDYASIYDSSWNYIGQGDGTGQTIAIVIAYDNPFISADLAAFDARYGIPDPPSFSVVQPQGTPVYNSGWALESDLDVEYSHAMAPGANILLVEAKDNSFGNLFGAVNYAKNQPGVSVVSMSWGANEFSGQTSYDGYFTTPGGHNGVTFVASSGDTGGARSYPAMSPSVVSVGGTNLTLSGGEYSNETGWSYSGGGISGYENRPDYQVGFSSNSHRAGPDVGYLAVGVNIITHGSLTSVSGTSVGAPQWAAMIAIADQQLSAWGYDTLDGRSQALPGLYGIAGWYGNGNYDGYDYHDVVTGTAGGNHAGPGYDLVTGLGTPIAPNLAVDLAYYTAQNTDGGPYTSQGGGAPLVNSGRATATQDAGTGTGVVQPGKNVTAKPRSILDNDPTVWTLVAQANSQTASSASTATTNFRGSDLRGSMDSPTNLRSSLTILSTPRLAHSEIDMDLGDLRIRPDNQETGIPMFRDDTGATGSRLTPIIAPINGGDWQAANLALSALSPDAVDAFFASDSWLKSLSDAMPGVPDAAPAASPLAAMAGLAVVMGSYWGAHVTEPESTRSQRFPSLPKV